MLHGNIGLMGFRFSIPVPVRYGYPIKCTGTNTPNFPLLSTGTAQGSVADPGCFIPDPGSGSEYLFIPGLGSRILVLCKKKG
jgi:hypothetical protein